METADIWAAQPCLTAYFSPLLFSALLPEACKKAITDKMARFIGSDIQLVGYARGEGFRVMTELEQQYKTGTTVGSAADWQPAENILQV